MLNEDIEGMASGQELESEHVKLGEKGYEVIERGSGGGSGEWMPIAPTEGKYVASGKEWSKLNWEDVGNKPEIPTPVANPVTYTDSTSKTITSPVSFGMQGNFMRLDIATGNIATIYCGNGSGDKALPCDIQCSAFTVNKQPVYTLPEATPAAPGGVKQADVVADLDVGADAAAIVTSVNDLLAKLRAAGVMAK